MRCLLWLAALTALLPGEYKLIVKAAGFKTFTGNVRLEVAQTLNLDLRLELGALIPGLRSDGTANLDFSAVKNNRVRDRVNLQLRFEWFNFTNRPRFDLPGLAIGTPGVGTVTAQANRPRTLQAALKMIF